jgi:hypothetical protein
VSAVGDGLVADALQLLQVERAAALGDEAVALAPHQHGWALHLRHLLVGEEVLGLQVPHESGDRRPLHDAAEVAREEAHAGGRLVKRAPQPVVHDPLLLGPHDAREVDPVLGPQRRASRVEERHGADELRPARGELGRDPASHGVPGEVGASRRDVDDEALGDLDQLREAEEVTPARRPRPSVAREVGDHQAVGGPELGHDGMEARARPAEPVEEDERRGACLAPRLPVYRWSPIASGRRGEARELGRRRVELDVPDARAGDGRLPDRGPPPAPVESQEPLDEPEHRAASPLPLPSPPPGGSAGGSPS